MKNPDDTTQESPQEKIQRGSARTCVGCNAADDRDSLVRLVSAPGDDGTVSVMVDAAGGAFGRGVHVHATPGCIEKAARGGIARSLRAQARITASELASQIRDAYGRRATGLLVAARRQRKVAVGADASMIALTDSPAATVVVATDAAHAATLAGVQNAIKEGRTAIWLDRTELGAVLGRQEVSVCVITDTRIGAALVSVSGVRNSLAPSGSQIRGVKHAGLGRFDE